MKKHPTKSEDINKPHIIQVQNLFDSCVSNGYEIEMSKGHHHTGRQAFDMLCVVPPMRYLDIGCGNGYSVRWAADVSSDVNAMGMDVSPQMIVRATAESKPRKNTRFVCGTFPQNLPEGESFDAVFSMESFYYFSNISEAIQSVYDCLVPGGHFALVVDYYKENKASHHWPELTGVNLTLLSSIEWKQMMEDAGFVLLTQTRLYKPLEEGAEQSWEQTEGSLLTLVRRPH